MRRTFEAIFRHPIQLVALLMLPLVLGLAIAYVLPRSYQASANLWALHRYAVIGATGPESDLLSTPSATQVAALSELLQSRAFALSVAKATNLVTTLHLSKSVLADPQLRDNALAAEVSQHVVVTSQGYNLYGISYVNRDPAVAQQIVATVIAEFNVQSQGFSTAEGQQLLDGYQTQLAQAKQAADAATQAEARYLAAHPALKTATSAALADPQYALLDAKRVQAQSLLQNIQSDIATVNQEMTLASTGQDALFQVVDAPIVPDTSVSRTKTFLIIGGAGLGLGLAACVVYLLVLIRRDSALYNTQDIQEVTTYPVLMQVPQLSQTILKHIAQQVAYSPIANSSHVQELISKPISR